MSYREQIDEMVFDVVGGLMLLVVSGLVLWTIVLALREIRERDGRDEDDDDHDE